MSKVGKRLIEAATEAAAIARGEKKPARIYVSGKLPLGAPEGKPKAKAPK